MPKLPVRRIVIDESVPRAELPRFDALAKTRGFNTSERLFIMDKYPGMPDEQILHHLLDETTVFLTSDRPFHNKVLSKGLRSYYLDKGKITAKPLRGIHIKPDTMPRALKEDYLPPTLEIRPLLLPDSASKLKKLTVKRRRIRNHFGGLDNLDMIAVTLSCKPWRSGVLIGIRIRISSNAGMKALDASESYIFESVEPGRHSPAAVCHVLILLIQLMLHRVKIQVYYDTPAIEDPVQISSLTDDYGRLFGALSAGFDNLEFIATPKGKLVERVRTKLENLAGKKNNNEIVPGNIAAIMQAFFTSCVTLT